MSTWQQEKERIFALTRDQRRKIYSDKYYVSVDDLADWDTQFLLSKKVIDPDPVSSPSYSVKKDINSRISIFAGDLTTLEIDAIVNPTDTHLSGGGSGTGIVDKLVHQKAGQFLDEECKSIGDCNPGHAKITGGYHLPADYVIHTVGPLNGNEDRCRRLLAHCYTAVLNLTKENGIKTLAFPCIATGSGNLNRDVAAEEALATVRNWLEDGDNREQIKRIVFAVYSPEDTMVYYKMIPKYFPYDNLL